MNITAREFWLSQDVPTLEFFVQFVLDLIGANPSNSKYVISLIVRIIIGQLFKHQCLDEIIILIRDFF